MIYCTMLQEMNPKHWDNMTSMNLNMYPSTEGHTFPEGAQRIWSHTDYEALTLLFQKSGKSVPLLLSEFKTSEQQALAGLMTVYASL